MIRLIASLSLCLVLCYSGFGLAEDSVEDQLFAEDEETETNANNVRITLTTTTATAITGFSQLLQSWSGAGCTGSILSNYISGSSGTIAVPTGTSSIYISTSGGQLCNTGSLNRSFTINNPGNVTTNAGVCTGSSGCVTVNCSNSSTVSSVVSTLTLTCP